MHYNLQFIYLVKFSVGCAAIVQFFSVKGEHRSWSSQARQNESHIALCNATLNLLNSLEVNLGERLEILAMVPPEVFQVCLLMLPSFNLPSELELSVAMCSPQNGEIYEYFLHQYVTHPIYVIIACSVNDTVWLFQNNFRPLVADIRWVIFDFAHPQDMDYIHRLSNVSNFGVNTSVFLVSNDRAEIQDLYRVGSSFHTRSVTTWEKSGERERGNLFGVTLRVVGVNDSYSDFDTKISTNAAGDPGFDDSFSIQILQALQFTLNFTVQVKVAESWGYFDSEKGQWDGMIKLLLDNKADLAISSTADLPFRRTAVDFNFPTNKLKIVAFFRRPGRSSNARALLEPFEPEFWIGILVVMISLGSTLVIFKYILVLTETGKDSHIIDSDSIKLDLHRLDTIGSMHREHEWEIWTDPHELWTPADCFQWAFGIFCLQGFYNLPKYDCCRIVIGIGCLSSVIIYGAYGGTLISFLSVAVETVTNLEQLTTGSFTLSIVNVPVSRKFFQESPSSVDRAIYHRQIKMPLYSRLDEAKKPLLRGSFVFFVDQISAYSNLNEKFTVRENCMIQELGVPYATQKQSSMVAKYSPYKRIIDYQILRMHEYGLIRQFNNRYIPSRIPCRTYLTFSGISLRSISAAFIPLVNGALISLLILIVEKRINQTKHEVPTRFCM